MTVESVGKWFRYDGSALTLGAEVRDIEDAPFARLIDQDEKNRPV